MELLRKAAEQGDADAQYRLAVWYEQSENAELEAEECIRSIRPFVERAYYCPERDIDYTVGPKESEGYIVPNLEQAFYWFHRAAEQEHADAQYQLGKFYCHGVGVPQNHNRAFLWWGKAAKQGNCKAQNGLGFLYCYAYSDFVFAKDLKQAEFWWNKAAEQGLISAQCNLGSYYSESTEKVQFFKDQNEKCLRFITFLSTNRLNKAMIGRKRRVKRLFLRY